MRRGGRAALASSSRFTSSLTLRTNPSTLRWGYNTSVNAWPLRAQSVRRNQTQAIASTIARVKEDDDMHGLISATNIIVASAATLVGFVLADKTNLKAEDLEVDESGKKEIESEEPLKETTDLDGLIFNKPILMVRDATEKKRLQGFHQVSVLALSPGITHISSGGLAANLKIHPAMLYYWHEQKGLQLYALSQEQLDNMEQTLADIKEGKLKEETRTQKVTETDEIFAQLKRKPVVLTRDNFDEIMKKDKDVLVYVHFADEQVWTASLLAKVYAKDDNMIVASYDLTCNLPFPELLAKNSTRIEKGGDYFKLFPKDDRANPVTYPGTLEDTELTLRLIIFLSELRKQGLKSLADSLWAGHVSGVAENLDNLSLSNRMIQEQHARHERRTASSQDSSKKKEKSEAAKKFKEATDQIEKEAKELKAALTRTALDYKKETKKLQQKLSDSMYEVQAEILKGVEKLPESKEEYQQALERLFKDRNENSEDKRVIVLFSLKGCGTCFNLSPVFASLAYYCPDTKFAWASANAVELESAPRVFIYDSVTGEHQVIGAAEFPEFYKGLLLAEIEKVKKKESDKSSAGGSEETPVEAGALESK